MVINAYLVDSIEVIELEDGSNKIISSHKINTITVPTLPFVNDIKVRIDLKNLVVGANVRLEIQIFDSTDQLIGYSGERKINATKENLTTWCEIKLVHTSISSYKVLLFVDGEVFNSELYEVEYENKEVNSLSQAQATRA